MINHQRQKSSIFAVETFALLFVIQKRHALRKNVPPTSTESAYGKFWTYPKNRVPECILCALCVQENAKMRKKRTREIIIAQEQSFVRSTSISFVRQVGRNDHKKKKRKMKLIPQPWQERGREDITPFLLYEEFNLSSLILRANVGEGRFASLNYMDLWNLARSRSSTQQFR